MLCRVVGVPVLLAPSWWFGAAMVVLLYLPVVARLLPGSGVGAAVLLALAFAVVLGLSVLLHELGHCLVAVHLGLPVRRVRLYLFGGITEIARTPARPAHEGMVAVAGPVVSAVLAVLPFGLWLLLEPDTPLRLLVAQIAVANALVAVANLLPGLPLDGGRLLRAAVWALTRRRNAGTRAGVVGAGLVATGLVWWALMGLADGVDDRWLRLAACVLMAWFVAAGAGTELAAEQRRQWPSDLRVAELVLPVLQLPAESPVADALTASAGRGVVLVRADGVAVGLLDPQAAQRLAETAPLAPAERAAEPIRPETVLLDSDPGEEVLERVRTTAAWQFLVVDAEGRPTGVLRREDLREALRRV